MAEGKDTSEIVVGGNGTIRVAPVGTTAPTDIATAFGAGWVDLGFADENGATLTDSKTLGEVDVWQLFYPGRRIIQKRSFTIQFNLCQWNEVTVPLAFGGGSVVKTVGPPAYYTYTPPDPSTVDERALAIEWVDGSSTFRLIVPKGLATANVASKITRTAAADLPITFDVTGVDGNAPWTLITNAAFFDTSTP